MKRLLILFAAVLISAMMALPGCGGGSGGLRVQVVEGNMGLPGAKVVSSEQPSGQLKVTGMTDRFGVATYDDIKAGEYTFYVSVAGYEQKDFTVKVERGKTANVTITMNRAAPPPGIT